ncbi:MAG: ankyrin repeat domain-containing protein [Planctomycetota bacterium]
MKSRLPIVVRFLSWLGVACLGMDASAVGPAGLTRLHQAVISSDIDQLREAIQAGEDVNARTDYGVTPLAIACASGDEASVGVLLAAGGDPNAELTGGVTCLMRASRAGNVDVVTQLIRQGAGINKVQRNGQTALMFAAVEGHESVVNCLVEHGADVQKTVDAGFTAMHLAARQGHIATVMRLIDAGIDVRAEMSPKRTSGRNPRDGMTALMLAVESGHFELAMRLIDRGADPNEQSSGYTPLHAISWVRRAQLGDNPAGDPEPSGSGILTSLQFVEAIVEAGADVNAPLRRGRSGRARLNHRGATPLIMACHTLDVALVDLLLRLGADPTVTNHDGTTALLAAAGIGVVNPTDGYPGTFEELETIWTRLAELGLDIAVVDNNGETAMHGAAYRNWPEAVALVGTSGVKPSVWNRKNEYGWTPLMIAQGHRPGSFKPDPPTMAAIHQWLGD